MSLVGKRVPGCRWPGRGRRGTPPRPATSGHRPGRRRRWSRNICPILASGHAWRRGNPRNSIFHTYPGVRRGELSRGAEQLPEKRSVAASKHLTMPLRGSGRTCRPARVRRPRWGCPRWSRPGGLSTSPGVSLGKRSESCLRWPRRAGRAAPSRARPCCDRRYGPIAANRLPATGPPAGRPPLPRRPSECCASLSSARASIPRQVPLAGADAVGLIPERSPVGAIGLIDVDSILGRIGARRKDSVADHLADRNAGWVGSRACRTA